MRILRTFHIPAAGYFPDSINDRISITEMSDPNLVKVEIGANVVLLQKEAFEAMCNLRYEVKWTSETNEEAP